MAPWPDPPLSLAVAVSTTPQGRTRAVYTITGAKAPTAQLDPGDGSEPVSVPISGGTGTAMHTYADPGHHTYTASVNAACPQLWKTWGEVPAAATWHEVPELARTWGDAVRTEESATATATVDVGPATVWATVVPADPVPLIQVDTWIGDQDNVVLWTIERQCRDAVPDLNTVIWQRRTHPGAQSIEDREAPFGVPVTYRLAVTFRDSTKASATSEPVVITGTRGCVLTSTMTGQTIPIALKSWDEREREARQSVMAVMNRPDPVVVSDVHSTASGTWVILTYTRADLDNLYTVLLGARLVLLRSQPGSSIRSVYAAVGTITEARLYVEDGAAEHRLVSVAVQEVAPIPATARDSSVTWGQLAAAFATWGELAEALPTWQDVSEWRPGDAA
jgi:hypothetical protein